MTGICMIGPACIVRSRIATPAAHSTAAPFRRSASTYSPTRSASSPPT